jgi:hypothetical protein
MQDQFEHTLQITIDLAVPNPKNAKSTLRQMGIAHYIAAQLA